MTWTAWYVLLPAACAVSLVVHEFKQWQWPKRTVDRHVNTAVDFPTWEAELDRPYNWQDDGL